MKQWEKYTETIERQNLIRITCDRCGLIVPERTNSYNQREFRLEFATGYSYPEGGKVEGWAVEDLCDNCAEWLRSFLVKSGVMLQAIEKGW